MFLVFQQRKQWRRGRKIKRAKRVWVLQFQFHQFSLSLCGSVLICCVNVSLQFFEELSTESKPEKADEVAVKETQGKQVGLILTVYITKFTACYLTSLTNINYGFVGLISEFWDSVDLWHFSFKLFTLRKRRKTGGKEKEEMQTRTMTRTSCWSWKNSRCKRATRKTSQVWYFFAVI